MLSYIGKAQEKMMKDRPGTASQRSVMGSRMQSSRMQGVKSKINSGASQMKPASRPSNNWVKDLTINLSKADIFFVKAI